MKPINQMFPAQFDNDYRGHKLALWLFGVVIFMRGAMSLNSIFNGRKVASTADGIPLETFTAASAQTVVSMFALLGLGTLVICILGIVVLIRYRTMVPLIFALLLVQSLGGRLIFWFLPIPRTGTTVGFYVNLGILVLMIIGLPISLWNQTTRSSEPALMRGVDEHVP